MSQAAILHIDDDANDVLLFEHACQKAACPMEVHSLGDGESVLDYLRGAGEYADRQRFPVPALVLLDLKLPRLDGFEVLAWIRQQSGFRRLPVVVLSASNHETDVNRAYELGANSYLVKPVGFDALVQLVQTLHHYWVTLNQPPEVTRSGDL